MGVSDTQYTPRSSFRYHKLSTICFPIIILDVNQYHSLIYLPYLYIERFYITIHRDMFSLRIHIHGLTPTLKILNCLQIAGSNTTSKCLIHMNFCLLMCVAGSHLLNLYIQSNRQTVTVTTGHCLSTYIWDLPAAKNGWHLL